MLYIVNERASEAPEGNIRSWEVVAALVGMSAIGVANTLVERIPDYYTVPTIGAGAAIALTGLVSALRRVV